MVKDSKEAFAVSLSIEITVTSQRFSSTAVKWSHQNFLVFEAFFEDPLAFRTLTTS